MSKSSEAVKRWRKNTKARIIKAMGGECQICGYNKCQTALALHHKNPSEKDFSFGAIRSNPKTWSKVVCELRKCVLICHNCHSELHEGLIKLPNDVAVFDETFVVYKEVAIQTPCPICEKLKPERNTYCSLSCSGKSKNKIDWGKYDLIRMKKTMTFIAMGDMLGVSDRAVKKHMLTRNML